MAKNLIHKYSETYRNYVMATWFRNGKPPMTDVISLLKPDEAGETPTMSSLKLWRIDDSWDTRSDELQAMAAQKMDMTLVDERAEMMGRHAEVGKTLIDKGMQFLLDNDIKSINDALKTVALGQEIERISRIGKRVTDDIYSKSDTALMDDIKRMLSRGNTEINIYAGGPENKPDVVDAELRDLVDGEIDESSETTTE